MERSQSEGQSGRSQRRSSSPESKEESLLNVNAPTAASSAPSQPSFPGAIADSIRNATMRQYAMQQMMAAAPQPAPAAPAPANIANTLQALLNNQHLLSDSLRFGGRNNNLSNLSLQLMLAGQQNPFAAVSTNPFASTMLQGGNVNASERALQQLLMGAQAQNNRALAGAHLQRNYAGHVPAQSSQGLAGLGEREQTQLLLMQLNRERTVQPVDMSSSSNTALGSAGISTADLLMLTAPLNNESQAASAGDMLRGSLLGQGGPVASLGLLAQREQQLSQRASGDTDSGPSNQDVDAIDSASGAMQPKAERKEGEEEETKASVPEATVSKKRKASSRPDSAKSAKRRPREPVIIQGVPHHSEREFISLGIEEDPNWLSEFQCFVRSELMEVIQASQSDVLVRSTSKSILPAQVGVRCRYCAHLSPGSRVSRSSAFPSSLDKLYQSFSMMVRDHFGRCPEIPTEKAQKFQSLKGQNAQGATDSKQYWVYAAQKLGMVDAESGIERPEASRAAAEQMPPYGATREIALQPSKPLVLTDEEASRLTPFLKELLKHVEIIHLLAPERVGKRKGLPLGLEGLGCKFCCQQGRLGFSRCFPLRRRALLSHMYDLHRHFLRCPLCPDRVKEQLSQVNDGTDGAPISSNKDQDAYAIIWTKLGRQRDLTTS